MSYPYFPFGITITLIKRTVSGQNEYGNDIYDENPVLVSNCVYQPTSSSEDVQFTDQVATTDTFFVPANVDVSPLDLIEYNGMRYEVSGDPNEWVSPFSGRTSPTRVTANKVLGA